jgi:hypothetical protein
MWRKAFSALLGAAATVAMADCAPRTPAPPAVFSIPLAGGTAEVSAQPRDRPHARAADLVPSCPLQSPTILRESPLGGKPPQQSGAPNLMNPYFGDGFGFYPVVGRAPGPQAAAGAGPLELQLSTARAEHGPDATIDLALAFFNRSEHPILVLHPGDGSLEGWRYPRYDLYARAESDGTVYRFAYVGGRCGLVNPFAEEDYVSIEAGEVRRDLVTGWSDYLRQAKLPKRGRYTLWVVYAFCGFEIRGVLPTQGNTLHEQAYRGAVSSNPVSVVVR